MNQPSKSVDGYVRKNKRWQAELTGLRAILHDTLLVEGMKWGVPCYTLDGQNVALLHVFKEYCAILFMKGALLNDPHGLLVQQTKNVQAARQVRFTDADGVARHAAAVRAFVAEAIAAETAGLTVPKKTTNQFDVPEEFADKLAADPDLAAAFAALTPGRQRAYLLHFAGAKQSKTRAARVEKWTPAILDGRGLDD